MDVVTYQSPRGAEITLCEKHSSPRPKDRTGEEYCNVKWGKHRGTCDLCQNIEVDNG